MTDLELLKAARKLIEDSPRLLKSEFEQDGCYCIIGSFNPLVKHKHANAFIKMDKKAAKLLGFGEPCFAYSWNDAPERTKEDVLARFDEAIAKLECGEST